MFPNGSLSVSSQSQAAGRGRWRDFLPVSPAAFFNARPASFGRAGGARSKLRDHAAGAKMEVEPKRLSGRVAARPGGLTVNGSKPSLFQFRALLGRAMRWIVGRRLNSEQVNVNLHCIAHYVIRPSGIIVCRSVKISAVLRLFDDDTQDFAEAKKHVNRSFPWINRNTKGTVGCAEKFGIGSVK